MPNPLCFVLMPFGRKSSPLGEIIDFDAVYLQIIELFKARKEWLNSRSMVPSVSCCV